MYALIVEKYSSVTTVMNGRSENMSEELMCDRHRWNCPVWNNNPSSPQGQEEHWKQHMREVEKEISRQLEMAKLRLKQRNREKSLKEKLLSFLHLK